MSGLSPATRKELASLSPEERVEALRALVGRQELLRAAGLCANHCNHLTGYGALCLRPAGHEAADEIEGRPPRLHTNRGGRHWRSDDGTLWDETPPPRPARVAEVSTCSDCGSWLHATEAARCPGTATAEATHDA